MSTTSLTFVLFPGAGGGIPERAMFVADAPETVAMQTVRYPGWRHYPAGGLTAEHLIADLAAQVAELVPHGPINIVGISIGGHFGYAAALQLQAAGREIGGFCAIDSYMISSPALASGWVGRVGGRSWELLRGGRVGDFWSYARQLLWRTALRLPRDKLPSLLLELAPSGRLPRVFAFDPLIERELAMRLLIRATAPWVPTLDRQPVPLSAPAGLIRTEDAGGDDETWRRRCPELKVFEVPGCHLSLLEPENIATFRAAFTAAARCWLPARGA